MVNFRLRVSFLNVILSLNAIEQNLCDIAASVLYLTPSCLTYFYHKYIGFLKKQI